MVKKKAKKNKKETVKVYLCPRCNSVDVGYVFGLRNLLGIIPRMSCKNCGYHNITFPLAIVDKDKLNKKVRKKTKKITKKKRSKR